MRKITTLARAVTMTTSDHKTREKPLPIVYLCVCVLCKCVCACVCRACMCVSYFVNFWWQVILLIFIPSCHFASLHTMQVTDSRVSVPLQEQLPLARHSLAVSDRGNGKRKC